MIITSLALASAAAFTGAAAYINWSEQPARLTLDDASLLKERKFSYAKGLEMQASLAVVSGPLGLAAFYFGHRLMAAVGGLLMLANWPYTFLAINPTNRQLGAMADSGAGSRQLIEKWGQAARRAYAARLCRPLCFLVRANLGLALSRHGAAAVACASSQPDDCCRSTP